MVADNACADAPWLRRKGRLAGGEDYGSRPRLDCCASSRGGTSMKDLIEALSIFLKYKDDANPTHCEHDVLCVVGITLDEISAMDRDRLKVLGFHYSKSDCCWISYRFGSA